MSVDQLIKALEHIRTQGYGKLQIAVISPGDRDGPECARTVDFAMVKVTNFYSYASRESGAKKVVEFKFGELL